MSGSVRAYKTRAIVLRARNLGEADKIFTLFTDARGKIDAVGKGVRRAKSQLAGKLEFMSEAVLTMHRGRSLDIVTSAEIERAHWVEIVEPGRFVTAHLIAELVDAFCEIDFAMPEIYLMLRGVLRAISASEDPASFVPRFQLRLLGALGLAPTAGTCVRCDIRLSGLEAWADIEAGGLACSRCRPHRADAFALTPEDVRNFRGLAAGAGEEIPAIMQATPAASRAVDAFLHWHLGKRPKSSKLLDDLAHA